MIPLNSFAFKILSVSLVLLSLATRSDAQSFKFSAVALSGESASGTSSGVNYSHFDFPAINSTGEVTFSADLSGPGVVSGSNNQGIWAGTPAGVSLVLRIGNQAPGFAPGTTYEFFQELSPATPGGSIAYTATLSSLPSENVEGLWYGQPGSSSLVLATGSQAPGFATGDTFGNFKTMGMNSSGQLIFDATIAGPGTPFIGTDSLWSGTQTNLALVVATGNQAPGMPSGALFDSLGAGTTPPALINASGQTVFSGYVTGGGVTGANYQGIWLGKPGNVALAERTGNAAPGTSLNFASFDNPTLNSTGEIAFQGTLTGTTNIYGIWSGSPGSVQLVVRNGQQAPGAGSGATFSSFVDPSLNATGQTAFNTFLTGPNITSSNNQALYRATPGNLSLVLQSGEQAPGTSPGTLFSSWSPPAFNALGNMLIEADTTSDGGQSSNYGLWYASASTGSLSLIAMDGSPFQVAPGDIRTLSGFQLTGFDAGDEIGIGRALNDSNEFTFVADFTDGSSGVFTAALVPEPSTWVILSIGVVTLYVVRMRFRRNS